ncbi:MAG: 30S ribosomal protein S9 [Candidatus Aenigmarchaeota archaeon]|nr:30S ribosomal protein S9 [Candidatus Aenigmarchaeota archaeon]
MTKEKIIQTIGKRKKSVAKALIKKGTGKVRVNKKPLETIKPEMIRLMIEEPLILSGNLSKEVNIDVTVSGGGVVSQAESIRQAIGRGLVKFGGKNIEKIMLEYDKSILVTDPRRTEPHKPSRSSAGPRRHKQRSKR